MDQFRTWQQDGRQWAEDFFIYTINFGSLANGATNNANINIQKDSYFEWIMSTCWGNLHGATPPWTDGVLIPVNLQVTDTGSGRQLFQSAVPINSLAGTGKQPFILPVSRIFMGTSTVNFFATNFDTVAETFDNIILNLIGRKIFDVTEIMRRPNGAPGR